MQSPIPLPSVWPEFDWGDPAARKVETRGGALDNIRTLRGISMVIVALGLLVVFFHVSPKVERLARQGIVIQATVDERFIPTGEEGESYRIGYTYRVGGAPYHGRMSVNKRQYEAIPKGYVLPITVLPSYPREHRVGTVGERDVQKVRKDGSLLVFAIALPFALLALGIQAGIRREKRILTTWFPLPAQVFDLVKKTSDEGEYFVMHYRISLPNGKIVTKKRILSEAEAKSITLGDFFPVLAPPGDLYIQDRLRTLSSLKSVQLVSSAPEPIHRRQAG